MIADLRLSLELLLGRKTCLADASCMKIENSEVYLDLSPVLSKTHRFLAMWETIAEQNWALV